MPASVTLKALGLVTSPNQLDVPAGSLTLAENIVIKEDNIIAQRRGFKIFGETFGSSGDRAKQLFSYRDRILRHFSDKIEFETGTVTTSGVAIFNEFAGSYSETETGLRMKSIEANGNLYLTTSEGIKKLSAKTADQLTTAPGFITQAGGVKAVDLTAIINYEFGDQTSFLPQDSAVAYRVLWSTKDANGNLVAGTPSQRAEVYNSLLTLLLQDFAFTLGSLDNINQTGSIIDDGDYVSSLFLPITASASELRTSLISLAQKLDFDIKYADETSPGSYPLDILSVSVTSNVVTITFLTGDPTNYFVSGSKIEISGFTDNAAASLDGTYTLTAVTATTISFNQTAAAGAGTVSGTAFIRSNEYRSITQPGIPSTPSTDAQLVEIQDYLSNIMIRLQSEPTAVISAPLAAAYIDILDVTTTASVTLTITIPQDVTDQYFLQIYRSDITQATGVVILTDLTPNDEMKLVYEAYPTSAELAVFEMVVTDITPDIFRGANLYTNEATGEGLAQANGIPPFAKDINNFKGYTFYANTKTLQRSLISLLGVINMITDYFEGLNTQTFTSVDVNTGTETITIATHGFQDGQSIQFSNPTPSNLPGGIIQSQTYYILNSTINTFQISNIRFGAAVDLTSGGTGTHTVKNQLPKLVISNGTTTNTYSFVVGVQEQTQIITTAGSTLAASGTADSFFINSANDAIEYVVSYIIGTAIAPSIAGKTNINIVADAADTATQIAEKTVNTLNTYISDFFATNITNTVTVSNISSGYTTDTIDNTTGFTITTTVQGIGEDALTNQVLLSNLTSVGQAVDETARSLVRVINKNTNEIINAFYLSTAGGVPGQMFFEAKTLSDQPFYILGNNDSTGLSFNPSIAPENFIVSNTVANPTVITTSSTHGLVNGDQVVIVGSNSTPSIDGLFDITYISTTSFSIPVNVTVAENTGSMINSENALFSDNEEKANRIYYSKFQQPEAVPLVNYIDVASQDQPILRIFPLRDSLFVFKTDGLFRISGETAPFVTALFDTSCVLQAADSVSITNNNIFCWTDNGLNIVTESGTEVISRSIDNIILPTGSNNYTNFPTATWGIGYDSDNSYTVFTVKETTDEAAQIGYRYDTITKAFTTVDKDYTCGIINQKDDKMYVGAGDTNAIEQERKQFARYDYADRELSLELTGNKYFDLLMQFFSVVGIEEGDVLVQEQLLTIYQFNQTLRKLDTDAQVNDQDYYSTIHANNGDSLRTSIINLADKLDADSGIADSDYFNNIDTKSGFITSISIANPTIITTSIPHELNTGRIITITGGNSDPTVNDTYPVTVLSSTTFSVPVNVNMTAGTTGSFSTIDTDFRDIQACYNVIIAKLNADTGVNFSNYQSSTGTTIQESVITSMNIVKKQITVNMILPYVQGPMTVFKAIKSQFIYTPITFDDPLSFKHIRESTMMFANKAFTNAVLSFATDLLPMFEPVPFNGDGNGIFGFSPFGAGFFGGGSSGAPFRTLIPRNKSRCIYLRIKFNHGIAREIYQIYGLTLVGEIGLSSRAYR